jgi:nucleoside-diphosphate-sugar epimerase
LIIGASGFLGTHLASKISEVDKVYCASIDPSSNSDCEESIYYDVTDPTAVERLPSKVDVVYYLAMSPLYHDFPNRADDVWDVNVSGLFHVLEYARKSHVQHFILASTGSVYDRSRKLLSEESPLAIGTGCGFYAASKIAAEALLNSYSNYFSVCCLRLFYPYGGNLSSSMLLPRMMYHVKNNLPIVLDGEDGFEMNPIYIDDAVDACVAAAQLQGFHTINVAGPENISLGVLCRIMSELLETSVPPNFVVGGEWWTIATSIDKMCKFLTAPRIGIREGLRRFVKSIS